MSLPEPAYPALLERLLQGESLSSEEAQAAMGQLVAGNWDAARMAALLVALRQKGETAEELAGFVRALQEAAIPVHVAAGAMDVCGTGGDGSGTFNISTTAALVAVAGGARIVKHGNRAVSSRSGSADVLEALGVPIALDPPQAEQMMEQMGFVFLFAPAYHPAMRHVAPVRRSLKVRTVFNLLGPMVNPARPTVQLMGVYAPELQRMVVEALALSGVERALVVHGAGGLDELSTVGPSRLVELTRHGGIIERWVRPEDLGLEKVSLEALKGGDASTNAAIIEAILTGEDGPRREVVLLNAGTALYLYGLADSMATGVELAAAAIDDGRAADLLQRLRSWNLG